MDITIGQFNDIPDPKELFIPFKGTEAGPVTIGDCNYIGEGTRILVGPQGVKIGDYNVIHRLTTIGGPGPFVMGHNCWFGQENWLDSSGGLMLGNGVRVGLRSHIWSHVASGEQIEGWLIAFRPTVIEDNVWCVGDNVHIAPGVTMHQNSVAMAHSVITKDCEADTVYAGVPARQVSMKIRRDVSLKEKWAMMWRWAGEFADDGITESHMALTDTNEYIVIIRGGTEKLWIVCNDPSEAFYGPSQTVFNLVTKTYTKRLTQLERDFIHFLKGNKARFLPQNDNS